MELRPCDKISERPRESRSASRWRDFAIVEMAGKPDIRCATCAFRRGDHLANGSAETLMTAVKCIFERTPFWCHEHDRPCAGWLAMRVPEDRVVEMPWDHVGGADVP